MKTLTLILAAALSTLTLAETRLAVSIRGRPAGYATLSQHLDAAGNKVVELRMQLTSGNQKVILQTEARYDKLGRPIRKLQEATIPGGALHKQVIATFTKEGASVVDVNDEKRKVRNIPLAPTAPRACLSEFWFIRDQPAVGASERTYQFNTDTVAWDMVTTVFKGKRKLVIEGHEIQVNEIVTTRGDVVTTTYLDAEGLPVLVDQGDIKMVKIWPK